MVDKDKLRELRKRKGKGKSKKPKKKKGKSKSKSKKSSSSKDTSKAKPYNLTEDDPASEIQEEDLKVGEMSKTVAKSGELNYESTEKTLDQYKRRQKRELREMHKTMVSNAKKYCENAGMEDLDQFTVVLQALLFNLAQNRVGIAEILKEEYGLSESEAVREVNRMCKETNEKQAFENLVQFLMEKILE